MGLFGSGAIRINFALFDIFCSEDLLIISVFVPDMLVLGFDSLCPRHDVTVATAAAAATS